MLVFAVCRELVGGEAPASQQCSTPSIGHDPGCTSMHFGENQLSPCSIGISPLPTAHPNLLQQISVRAFTSCYARCTLAMGSSHGFRSAACHRCAVHTRVRYASGCDCLKRATRSNSSGHSPKGTRSRLSPRGPCALTAWTRSVSGSVSLPSPGCFSPFPHGTVRYRSRQVGRLGPWSAPLPTRFRVSRGTRDDCRRRARRWYGTITRCGASSQTLPSSARVLLTIGQDRRAGLTTPMTQRLPPWHVTGLGISPFRSPLLRAVYTSSRY